MLPTLNSTRWETFSGDPFETVRREFERGLGWNGNHSPEIQKPYVPVSLIEDDQHVYLELDLPGFAADEIDLTVQNGLLSIHGERKRPEYEGKCWYDERTYGKFERMISLSDVIDPNSVDASMENGVLMVTLAKKAEAQPHRIRINATGGSKGVEHK